LAIKLEMLRVFRTVAEHGGLNGAADALGRTPSAVSMMLAQFEDHVGAPLFEAGRKSRLTPLGRLVFDESSRATDAFARSVDAIGRHAMSTAGTVRIATVPSATITLLPGIIAAFRKLRPNVRLEISDVDSAAVRRRVKLDEADIGIVSASPGDPSESDVILEDDLGIVCRADGPIAAQAGQGGDRVWELLALEPLIANPLCNLVTSPCVAELLAACNLEARNTTALMSFVRGGLGATILPLSAVQDQPAGLLFVRPTNPPTRRQLRKICRDDVHLGPAARAFWASL
jgi:DNA-binding transcriptional LysR family regulator